MSAGSTHSDTAQIDQDAAAEFVTLCAWTRTVRFQGEWISVEAYLERRYGVVTTHGMSPAARHMLESEESPVPEREPAGETTSQLLSPRRLAAVRATGLLDSGESSGFDRLTRLGQNAVDLASLAVTEIESRVMAMGRLAR